MAGHPQRPPDLRGPGGYVQVAAKIKEQVLLGSRELGRLVTVGSASVLLPDEVRLNACKIGALGQGPLGAVFSRRSNRTLEDENPHYASA